MPKRIRVLIARLGMDAHWRGSIMVARALRDAGMEVVYTGLHQTVEQIVRTAIQEAVDVVGLSIMSGAHIPICRKLLEMMKNEGLQEIPVVVGGVIPKQDIPRLREEGIAGVFPGGTPFDEIVAGINEVAK